jgi:hypothetical protein
LRLNDIFPGKDENNALGAMKDYVDKNAAYANSVSNRRLFGEITPEAKAIGEKSKLEAERYGAIHKMAPHLTPGVVLSLVSSGASDQVVAKVGLAALAVEKEKAEQEDNDRNILGDAYAVLKTGTRWVGMTANSALDFANTAATSTFFDAANSPEQGKFLKWNPKNPFRSGVFASTELGAAIANPTDTGTGIFGIGGEAAQYKSRKQMEFAGSIPLTIEAGAAENTAFQADPDQINTLAMQILATKDITYEEAYDEANRMIRSEARQALTFSGIAPLSNFIPNIGSFKIGVDPNSRMPVLSIEKFEFGDIGTPEYAMTSAVATLALAAVLPDATVAAWRNVAKPLYSYGKGIKYVDEAGNFTMDSRNIAQNGAEAEFMAKMDSLNVMVNDFEVAGISAADEAVEMLTPEPGTWWHGSRGSGPADGNFLGIEDPRAPVGEHHLYGPGLYLTEANLMGTTYVSLNADGTRELLTQEEAILRGLVPKVNPDAIDIPTVRMGLPASEVPEGVEPGTLFRFREMEDYNPSLLNPEYGLSGQAEESFVSQLADLWVDSKNPQITGLELLGSEDPVTKLFTTLGIEDIVKTSHDRIVQDLLTKGISHTHGTVGAGLVTSNLQESLTIKIRNGELNDFFNSEFTLTANAVQTRLVNHLSEFAIQFGRAPSSIDELKSFKGTMSFDDITTKPISIANGDDVLRTDTLPYLGIDEDSFTLPNRTRLSSIFDSDINDIYAAHAKAMEEATANGQPYIGLNKWLDENPTIKQKYDLFREMSSLHRDPRVAYSPHLGDFVNGNFKSLFYSSSESLYPLMDTDDLTSGLRSVVEQSMFELSDRFNPIVSERIQRMNIDDVTKQTLEDVSTKNLSHPGIEDMPIWSAGTPQTRRSWLTVNEWLARNGIDGYMHQGGNVAGQGTYLHRVRVLFDPMKHLDVADVLTGERLPVNEAINKMRESGELATRAGELRTQADELQAMRDAGHIPGYGDAVDPETFNSFFTQSRAGKYAADKIWAAVEKTKDAVTGDEAWYDLWKMFDGKLPLNILDEIKNAGSKSEMVSIINKNVGYTPGLSNIGDLNFSLSKTFDQLKSVSRIDTLMEKASEFAGPLFGRSPKSKTLNFFGSQREQLQALKDLDAFITTGVRGDVNISADTGYNLKKRTMFQFAEAMRTGDRTYMYSISQNIADIIKYRILNETKDTLQAQAASDLWASAFDSASGRGIYSVGEAGRRTDNGYAAVLADNGKLELRGMEHGGPALLSELQNTPLELPDIQALRRMTTFLGVFTGKQGLQRFIKKSEFRTNALKTFGVDLSKKDLEKLGELRIPLRLTDFVMTKVWKNSKKLSLAYGLRNSMEAQARLAFSDIDNVYTHPVDHILVATHNRIPDDIALGEEFNPEGWSGLGQAHESAGEGYREMLAAAYYGSDGRMDMVASQFKNGEFVVYSKDNPSKWAKAGAYELRQLFNDPIARRLAGGADTDSVIKWLNSDDPIAQKALREIKNTMSSGEVFYDSAGYAKIVPVEPTPANIRLRIESMQKERVALKTGSDPSLTEVVSQGQLNGVDAFKPNGSATKELLDYLASRVQDTNLPSFYKGRGESASLIKMKESQFDQAVNWFFNGLVGRAHNFMDRSPLWRQEYTKEVNRLAVLMSPKAAAEMKALILNRTSHYDSIAQSKGFARTFTLKDYLGKNVDADELFESLDNAKGWMSRDEVHAFANALTLDKIEGLLFDATARNSITDAARIVSPFGAAFAEVTKTWAGLLAKNPDKVVSLGRKYEILTGDRESEALQNKGLLRKDPISGDMMYFLPGSGSIFKMFNKLTGGEDTGSNYNLQAPVKGMNMVFNFTPGFSPIVGFPFGKLLYGSPKLRDFASFLLPYGQPKSPTDIKEYMPGWMSKIVSGLLDNPRTPGVFGDTLSEVMRVEMATGKYDLSDPDQRSQFEKDVEHKARILTMMRGIGQGLGPSSPTVEAKVRTKSGDIFSGYLTAEFHKLQSEDYDTAIERFLFMFGEETFGFMAGKTKSLVSGVESTSEFAKWELENADLFDTPYGDIAGFFAPKGSNYDHAAWVYQINTGKRERIPPIPTQVEIAEYVLGMHKYRALVNAAGPRPNEKQRTAIAEQKLLLEAEYPGMVTQSVLDVEKSKKNMKMLRLATQDSRLKDNETVIALKDYLDFRDMAIAGAKAAGNEWGSDAAAGLRAVLRFQGQRLVKETPEFARVFDRLLLPELDK